MSTLKRYQKRTFKITIVQNGLLFDFHTLISINRKYITQCVIKNGTENCHFIQWK